MAAIMLTGIDEAAVNRLQYTAGRLKLTPGQYVARLVELHKDLQHFADSASDATEIVELLRANRL
jgi:hypothetical protein